MLEDETVICTGSSESWLVVHTLNVMSWRISHDSCKQKLPSSSTGLLQFQVYTLYTTLPHNLIKEKLTELIEQIFNRESSLYLACNDKNAFFTSEQPKRYKLWSCQKMCDALH